MPQNNTIAPDEGFNVVSRRNAMKSGAALAGGLALSGTTAGTSVTDIPTPELESGNVDMFLRLEGVEGESTDHAHETQIDILAWRWGGLNTSTLHVARGGERGETEFQDISVTKFVDAATPALWLGMARGSQFETAELTFRTAGGDEPVDFLIIELENVLLTGIETGGTIDSQQVEQVALHFARFSMTYTPQDGTGGPLPEIGPIRWDLRRDEEF